MTTENIIEATKKFKETWGSGHLACDIATKLTCCELEALTQLLRAIDAHDSAQTWTERHADGDECGDLHCQCDHPECGKQRSKDT